MLKSTFSLLVLLVIVQTTLAQIPDDVKAAFEPLVGHTWATEGTWGSGDVFKQRATYRWGLNGKIVQVSTWGNIAEEGYEEGLRNEGIRAWDNSTESVRFWEYDVFGNVSTGDVHAEGRNIYYSYPYDTEEGTMTITDAYIYEAEDKYLLKIGVYTEGTWEQVFLEGKVLRVD